MPEARKRPVVEANTGYLRFPSLHGDEIAFVCEDDLWLVAESGGPARRMTANLAEVSHPHFSPDGRWISFTSREEHHPEMWCLPVAGGPARRLTWFGAKATTTVGWTPQGRALAVSNAGAPFGYWTRPYSVDPAGGAAELLPYGPCRAISYGPAGSVVLGRHATDPARWKRYRGGTAGQLWVDARGNGNFRRILADLDGNPAFPMWVGARIYFLADHEGIGNLYSCRPNGTDLRRHTDHDSYYARFASTDGERIVYAHAAEVWLFDPSADTTRRLDVQLASARVQRSRRFVPAERYLGEYAVHPRGEAIAVQARGQLHRFPLWEDHVAPLGRTDGVRHRLACWLPNGDSVAAVSDESGEDRLVVYDAAGAARRYDELDLGVPWELVASPRGDTLAVVNQRHELIAVDLADATSRVLDVGEHGQLGEVAWSPDGRWLAYSAALNDKTTSIKICELATGRAVAVTRAEFRDFAPAFDPSGAALYFLSSRVFDPVPDELFFSLGFPRTVKPFALPLRLDTRSPFQPRPRGMAAERADAQAGEVRPAGGSAVGAATGRKPARGGSAADLPQVRIDFDRIDRRAVEFPVPTGRYLSLAATPGRVLLLAADIEGSLDSDIFDPKPPEHRVEAFDFDTLRLEVLAEKVAGFRCSADGGTIVYRCGERLRAWKVGEKPPEGEQAAGEASRRNGWLDLDRIRLNIDPGAEWRQMFLEAWRLQRDYFWVPDMSGVDWRRVRDRYAPLLDKLGSRGDFSDLMWEMQGELGTSHAYELGGDYRPAPNYAMGMLGADFELDTRSGRWQIAHIVRADHWNARNGSPLEAPGVNVAEGDTVLAVNGRPVDRERAPQAELVHQAGLAVELTVADRRGRNPRRVVVTTIRDEMPLRYREWVEDRRRYVHQATDGRVGYVHLPNMGTPGFAEFHRSYLAELTREALVVDVRDNSGGYVSQMLLEKLARRRIGYDVHRYDPALAYPEDSPAGPLVCVTNQNAGSDGDIFSHCFKLMGLGELVGTRTWGGVIGISPRHRLVDGSVTTQPAYSFWFTDVGWGVENYGTDPTVPVDLTPADWAGGVDAQLDRAIQIVTRELRKARPARPDLAHRPKLSLPTLPPRR